ncbi:MAG TPA: glycoside hydrolase family 130 protein [Terrimicrobiaceae bacterium]|nr:glycoside hydrolase family 130 protein [Terrimicrobiaceae bacterium]
MVTRHPANPLLKPSDLAPSGPDLEIVCLLNPGIFRFAGRIWMIVRVAERPVKIPGKIRIAIREHGDLRVLEWNETDPDLDLSDPREIRHKGRAFLSTLSHLRLLQSTDGVHFAETGEHPPLHGEGRAEAFGIEDCRVASLEDGRFLLTYTAVSADGYGVGLRVTRDWRTFENLGMILPPANKDCAIFDEQIGGRYACLHRPSGVIVGGHFLWLGWSGDLRHWGGHRCLARTRPGWWDSARIGAGCAPIRTERGWLTIYHGANADHRYCLGALLLDLANPEIVLARSKHPVMEPEAPYETCGFLGNVIFTNGHLVNGRQIEMYYGASDTVICHASLSIDAILAGLEPV